MIYYKINNYYSWFEDEYLYINNLITKETNVLKILSYEKNTTNNSIFLYKEYIIIKDIDKVIVVDFNTINSIIESKKRELKINKILNGI